MCSLCSIEVSDNFFTEFGFKSCFITFSITSFIQLNYCTFLAKEKQYFCLLGSVFCEDCFKLHSRNSSIVSIPKFSFSFCIFFYLNHLCKHPFEKRNFRTIENLFSRNICMFPTFLRKSYNIRFTKKKPRVSQNLITM